MARTKQTRRIQKNVIRRPPRRAVHQQPPLPPPFERRAQHGMGDGLRCTRDCAKGTFVSYGEAAVVDEGGELSAYAIEDEAGNVLDFGSALDRGLACYANDGTVRRSRDGEMVSTGAKPNAELVQVEGKWVARLLRPLKQGQWVSIAYGERYWNADRSTFALRSSQLTSMSQSWQDGLHAMFSSPSNAYLDGVFSESSDGGVRALLSVYHLDAHADALLADGALQLSKDAALSDVEVRALAKRCGLNIESRRWLICAIASRWCTKESAAETKLPSTATISHRADLEQIASAVDVCGAAEAQLRAARVRVAEEAERSRADVRAHFTEARRQLDARDAELGRGVATQLETIVTHHRELQRGVDAAQRQLEVARQVCSKVLLISDCSRLTSRRDIVTGAVKRAVAHSDAAVERCSAGAAQSVVRVDFPRRIEHSLSSRARVLVHAVAPALTLSNATWLRILAFACNPLHAKEWALNLVSVELTCTNLAMRKVALGSIGVNAFYFAAHAVLRTEPLLAPSHAVAMLARDESAPLHRHHAGVCAAASKRKKPAFGAAPVNPAAVGAAWQPLPIRVANKKVPHKPLTYSYMGAQCRDASKSALEVRYHKYIAGSVSSALNPLHVRVSRKSKRGREHVREHVAAASKTHVIASESASKSDDYDGDRKSLSRASSRSRQPRSTLIDAAELVLTKRGEGDALQEMDAAYRRAVESQISLSLVEAAACAACQWPAIIESEQVISVLDAIHAEIVSLSADSNESGTKNLTVPPTHRASLLSPPPLAAAPDVIPHVPRLGTSELLREVQCAAARSAALRAMWRMALSNYRPSPNMISGMEWNREDCHSNCTILPAEDGEPALRVTTNKSAGTSNFLVRATQPILPSNCPFYWEVLVESYHGGGYGYNGVGVATASCPVEMISRNTNMNGWRGEDESPVVAPPGWYGACPGSGSGGSDDGTLVGGEDGILMGFLLTHDFATGCYGFEVWSGKHPSPSSFVTQTEGKDASRSFLTRKDAYCVDSIELLGDDVGLYPALALGALEQSNIYAAKFDAELSRSRFEFEVEVRGPLWVEHDVDDDSEW